MMFRLGFCGQALVVGVNHARLSYMPAWNSCYLYDNLSVQNNSLVADLNPSVHTLPRCCFMHCELMPPF